MVDRAHSLGTATVGHLGLKGPFLWPICFCITCSANTADRASVVRNMCEQRGHHSQTSSANIACLPQRLRSADGENEEGDCMLRLATPMDPSGKEEEMRREK